MNDKSNSENPTSAEDKDKNHWLSLGAWILGMDRRKTILAVFGGVIIAGIIVAAVFTLGIKALYFFLK